MTSLQGFPYGASYSPLMYPESDWENDLANMRAAGMNLIRLGDVHGSWDRIEPRPGKYEFDCLARFYQKAAQFGIHILISTGTSAPPLWLATEFPDIFLLSSRGERYPLGASYHWACIHHAGFLRAAENYILQLTEFVLQHPNHFGWQITNEIGFPFLPAREQSELGLYCYCDYCQAAFRDWLQEKYQNLESLTDAWAWGTTNFVYTHWAEVCAPESLPASWSGVTRWIDWRLFWQQAFADFAGWQHQLIRQSDEDHPTSVNTFNFKGYDRFGTFMGLDQWKIAQQVDHIGYDLYPGSGDKLASRPEHNSIFLDHGRSVCQTTGRDFWMHEIESGPIGGWLLGPQHNTDARDILNNCIESIGHNAKLLLFMPWKEWHYQPLHWGALVELDGAPTDRLDAAAQLGRLLQDHAEFLKSAQVPASQVAILESKPNAIFLRGVNQEELLFKAQRGAYRAFWDLGFSVDFITPEGLNTANLDQYRYICLPLVGLLAEDDMRALDEYARCGGIVIGFARLAALDTQGWYQHTLPHPTLGKLFGIEKITPDTLRNESISFAGNEYQAWFNRDQLKLQKNVTVLARFSDDLPAVSMAKRGQGLGVYLATQADMAHIENPAESLLQNVIERINHEKQILPQFQMEFDSPRATGIDPHFLSDGKKLWILFSNYLKHDREGILSANVDTITTPKIIREIFPNNLNLPFSVEQGLLSIQLKFSKKEVKIIEILME
jgi:beta-galactosidase